MIDWCPVGLFVIHREERSYFVAVVSIKEVHTQVLNYDHLLEAAPSPVPGLLEKANSQKFTYLPSSCRAHRFGVKRARPDVGPLLCLILIAGFRISQGLTSARFWTCKACRWVCACACVNHGGLKIGFPVGFPVRKPTKKTQATPT